MVCSQCNFLNITAVNRGDEYAKETTLYCQSSGLPHLELQIK